MIQPQQQPHTNPKAHPNRKDHSTVMETLMEPQFYAVYDESDTLRVVSREEYLRQTQLSPETIEHYAAALRVAGYMVIEEKLAKEMIQSHQIVAMLKAESQKRREGSTDKEPH
jgi:hypothetical protein